ncbi:MAG: GGDEF domain-containing protein [Pseudomonadota bacterium]
MLVKPGADPRRPVLRLLGCVSSGVLLYGYATLQLADRLLLAQSGGISPGLAAVMAVVRDTTWAFYWVMALIVAFIAFFGYQMFVHWQSLTNQLLDELRVANQRLYTLAGTDSLTGLHNRRVADERIAAEWQRARRLGHGAALLMIDIDHFKRINDGHGHPVGDEAIRMLAAEIRAMTRDIDSACRYGGEEFLIILPQVDAEGAHAFAERLRQRVAELPVACAGGTLHITISLGIACSMRPSRAISGGSNAATMRCTRPSATAATAWCCGPPDLVPQELIPVLHRHHTRTYTCTVAVLA